MTTVTTDIAKKVVPLIKELTSILEEVSSAVTKAFDPKEEEELFYLLYEWLKPVVKYLEKPDLTWGETKIPQRGILICNWSENLGGIHNFLIYTRKGIEIWTKGYGEKTAHLKANENVFSVFKSGYFPGRIDNVLEGVKIVVQSLRTALQDAIAKLRTRAQQMQDREKTLTTILEFLAGETS